MVGLRIADAAHDRQLPLVPQLSQTLHRGVETQLLVEVYDIARGIGQFGASIMICVVGVRNQGVDSVVSAVQRDDHQDAGIGGQRPVLCRAQQVGPTDRHRCRQESSRPGTRAGDQESAASDHDVKYSGVLTAAAANCGGCRTKGCSALTVRSDHAPTPIK